MPQHYLLRTHVSVDRKVTRSREMFDGVGTVPDVPCISIGSDAFTSSMTLSAYPSNLPSAVCFAAHCCFQIGRWLPGLSEHKQMRGNKLRVCIQVRQATKGSPHSKDRGPVS